MTPAELNAAWRGLDAPTRAGLAYLATNGRQEHAGGLDDSERAALADACQRWTSGALTTEGLPFTSHDVTFDVEWQIDTRARITRAVEGVARKERDAAAESITQTVGRRTIGAVRATEHAPIDDLLGDIEAGAVMWDATLARWIPAQAEVAA